MTRIDFYIIETNTLQARLSFACKLITKAFALGHRLYIHCQDQHMLDALDHLLWAIPQGRFIPHDMAGECTQAPIALGCQAPPVSHFDVYVNLASQSPPSFTRFHRLIEVIDQEGAVLEYGRKNYRQYQQKHYPLHRHDLRKSTV